MRSVHAGPPTAIAMLVLCSLVVEGGPGWRTALESGTVEGVPDSLARDFLDPPVSARPYVWWHWMGPNFSKTGITQDLEAMKASGIGGATVFNITSAVQESHAPTEHNPWPHQTYRSAAYWDALRHAAAEADRLGLELGLHNTVGYSTTGGPWIDEPRSMQRLVWSQAEVEGGVLVAVTLPVPPIPPFKGWGSTGRELKYFRDIAVLAAPAGRTTIAVTDVVDITTRLSASGELRWDAPAGRWVIYRIGHASTGASPHPVPDELVGKTLEADKLSAEQTLFHWRHVLEPLAQRLGPFLGRSLKHLLIDSYEAGDQNWTPGFREEFRRRKGYDPMPWLATMGAFVTGNPDATPVRAIENAEMSARFEWDCREVVAELYRENSWTPAAAMIHAAKATLQFEPYGGPFDTVAAAALADVPMVEFWSDGDGSVNQAVVGAARAAGRNVIGAEAFTGPPQGSRWTEAPARLKRSADGAFGSGVNRMVLHHWVHQPFDDRYKPAMGMGWWGTHFGRHQTWAEPGREFYRYLGRVQALLQRGEPLSDVLHVGTGATGGDLIPPRVFLDGVRVEQSRVALPSGRTYALIHVPHTGALEPAMVRRIQALLAAGANVVSPRPERSPSLSGYPGCDDDVRALAGALWGAADRSPERRVGLGRLFATLDAALRALAIEPFARVERGSSAGVRLHARRDGEATLIFVANTGAEAGHFTVSVAVRGLQPELWDAETGTLELAPLWRGAAARTEVDLTLGAAKSVFVVFRRPPAAGADHITSLQASGDCVLTNDASGRPVLTATASCTGTATFASGGSAAFDSVPAAVIDVSGPWTVELAPAVGTPQRIRLATLRSLTEQADPAVRHFSGTATYRRTVRIDESSVAAGTRVALDLGDIRDLVQVRVNGRDLGVIWHPPFRRDVTDALRAGDNLFELAVTNTWHNRLVGDEQFPADFEWGTDRGPDRGRAIKAYPEWFLQGRPRPSKGRQAFVVWSYHRGDTPLLPAGLVGPVRLLRMTTQVLEPRNGPASTRAVARSPEPWGDTLRLGRPFSKDPSVVRFRGRYLLYYSMPPFGDGRPIDGWGIGIAESTVLGDWAKVGEFLVAEPYEGKGVAAPFALVLAGRVHLFYQGYGAGPRDAICHAVSTDGLRFERDPTNPVFRPTGDWNVGRAIDAEVVRWGGRWHLYVATRDPQMKVQMLAGAVSDGGFDRSSWKMLADRPILAPVLPWEQDCIEAPTVLTTGATMFLFYGGAYNNAPQQVGLARSTDGIGWERVGEGPFLPNGQPGAWNWSESGHPAVFVDDDGQAYLFFQGNDDRGRTWRISFVRLGWRDGRPVVVPDEPPPGRAR